MRDFAVRFGVLIHQLVESARRLPPQKRNHWRFSFQVSQKHSWRVLRPILDKRLALLGQTVYKSGVIDTPNNDSEVNLWCATMKCVICNLLLHVAMHVKAFFLWGVVAPEQARSELVLSHCFGGTQRAASCFLSSGRGTKEAVPLFMY